MVHVFEMLLPCTLILSYIARIRAFDSFSPCHGQTGSFRTALTFGKMTSASVVSRDITLRLARCLGISECRISNVTIANCSTHVPTSLRISGNPAVEASVGFQDGGCILVRNCSSVLVDQEVYDTVGIPVRPIKFLF